MRLNHLRLFLPRCSTRTTRRRDNEPPLRPQYLAEGIRRYGESDGVLPYDVLLRLVKDCGGAMRISGGPSGIRDRAFRARPEVERIKSGGQLLIHNASSCRERPPAEPSHWATHVNSRNCEIPKFPVLRF